LYCISVALVVVLGCLFADAIIIILQWAATSSHKLRHKQDMQYAFTYFYYYIHETKEFNVSDSMWNVVVFFVCFFADTSQPKQKQCGTIG
jgi:Stealth protein CR3, conserved region 3